MLRLLVISFAIKLYAQTDGFAVATSKPIFGQTLAERVKGVHFACKLAHLVPWRS